MRFKSGVSAVVEGFMDITGQFGFTTNVRVNGSEASVEMLNKAVYLADGQTGKANNLVIYRKDSDPELVNVEKYDPYAREVEYFADCVQAAAETAMVAESGVIQVLSILAAIRQSLEEERVIHL